MKRYKVRFQIGNTTCTDIFEAESAKAVKEKVLQENGDDCQVLSVDFEGFPPIGSG